MNDEEAYPHFVHLFEPQKIESVIFFGDALISYIGFGPSGKYLSILKMRLEFLLLRLNASTSSHLQFDLCLSRRSCI